MEEAGNEAAQDKQLVNLDAKETFGPDVISLKQPFTLGGIAYREIRLRWPTGADIVKYFKDKNTAEEMDAFCADLAGMSVATLNAMYAQDKRAIVVRVGEHMGDGSTSGE